MSTTQTGLNRLLSLDAIVVVKDCKRYLVVKHKDIELKIEDEQMSLERPAVELLDVYCAQYMAELVPHTTKVIKLRALALALRRLQARPHLP